MDKKNYLFFVKKRLKNEKRTIESKKIFQDKILFLLGTSKTRAIDFSTHKIFPNYFNSHCDIKSSMSQQRTYIVIANTLCFSSLNTPLFAKTNRFKNTSRYDKNVLEKKNNNNNEKMSKQKH